MGNPVLLQTQKRSFFSSLEHHVIHALIPAFHGSEGENGAFQGLCETYNIPYAGSGIYGSTVAMDKIETKVLCRTFEIPVLQEASFNENEWDNHQRSILNEISALSYPVIVKPATLGSSIGVAKSIDEEELITAVETAFRYDERLLVESVVQPLTEINCSVLGTTDKARASVCERPVGKENMLSFDDKYQNDGAGEKGMASADRIIPADIPKEQRGTIQQMALKIFSIFKASGVARLDFLMNKDSGEIFFNEINTIPGSFSFYLWEEDG